MGVDADNPGSLPSQSCCLPSYSVRTRTQYHTDLFRFNQSKVRPSSILSVMLKLVPAYLFFGSCLYWYRLKMYYSDYESLKFLTSIPMKPYDRHYLLLGITCLELVVFIVTVLFSVGVWRHLFSKKSTLTNANIAKTILLSRFGMLLVILMMIWDYDINLGRVINVFVLTSNISALKVLLETSLVNATLVVAMGFMAQLLVRAAVHTYDPSFVFFMF